MHEIDIRADTLVRFLLSARPQGLCILDSCGVGKPGLNRLITGVEPVKAARLSGRDPLETLGRFDELLRSSQHAAIFTISYEFGRLLHRFPAKPTNEPDIFVALFDSLLIHDYDAGKTFAAGVPKECVALKERLSDASKFNPIPRSTPIHQARSNFSRSEYLIAVERIQGLIRAGETYQTNLTQQLTVELEDSTSPEDMFLHLRDKHPAPFAAFIGRGDSTVVSASPEEFIRVERSGKDRTITASPIKGTRPRGADKQEDEELRAELASSEKDRAENTMIVDLMRNDLGRVCKFGTVRVGDLHRIEEHPSLFHLVSSVSGELSENASYSDILMAVFPCGSITGAPKLRTMEVIDSIEPDPRGISMGAIGCRIPAGFGIGEMFEMSVAIRTFVIRGSKATFNVGGGVVIDSVPDAEYEESILKARALLNALNARLE